jgi:hypothetical protein
MNDSVYCFLFYNKHFIKSESLSSRNICTICTIVYAYIYNIKQVSICDL